MQRSTSVITQATAGLGEHLAEVYGVSPQRMYEILGKDNPYPKFRRPLRALASVDRKRLEVIRADLDALFDELIGSHAAPVGIGRMHKELSEAIQAKIDGLPSSERLRECREAAALLNREIAYLEHEEEAENRPTRLRQARTA